MGDNIAAELERGKRDLVTKQREGELLMEEVTRLERVAEARLEQVTSLPSALCSLLSALLSALCSLLSRFFSIYLLPRLYPKFITVLPLS
jgi:hypothetical protein